MESKVQSKFDQVEERPSFPKNEEKIIEFWRKIDAFRTQCKKTEECPVYTFYDGPPFATGMPHYGHLITGGLKDVVTRYWTQRGRSIVRRFGWDCHGLPIECIINKQLNIQTKKDLNAIGIEKYNAECRKVVMTYADDWKYYTERFGRWIDFDNDYRTMYPSFMETVWWVFKKIFEQNRVYRKCKVMPYSCACNTVLSNFEAGENYQVASDPSVVITLPLISDSKIKLLAWTTTPWTLPSNLFLTVNPKMDYVLVKANGDEEQQYILAESRLKEVMKQIKVNDKFEIIKKYKGEELVGMEYVPLFTEFVEKYKPKGCFKVYTADYVTAEDGTGIVHNAPGFGEDDYNVGVGYKLVDPDCPLCPMDEDGCFTAEFPMCQGIYFKKADPIIIEHLKKEKRLLFQGTINHKYPFCYRTNTPLMYRAIPSWFVRVEDMRDELVKNNKSTYWVPKYVQEKRFHNWLASARDWCISRNRSWGTPIPLWVSDDMEEKVCVGSIKELEELSGVKGITDLHREYIDKITIPSKMGKGTLKRIPEVFDCWFESGSMPYAQQHYPFEMTDEVFMKGFPADFIAEGLDQTRGWFYTLNILSNCLFKQTPYKNLVVSGLVLDEKGEKLSKSKGNYKDPRMLFDTYGADVVRLYLIDSPLVKGQSLKFSEKGLGQKIKDVFLPLYNSYRFLIQNVLRYEIHSGKNFMYNPQIFYNQNLNITDKWIIAYEQRLIKFFHQEMEHYRLYTVVSELLSFLDKLTNWYIRLNRARIKGDFGEEDWVNSLNVLFGTMVNLIILLSPFIPFITEFMYQNLKKGLDEKSPLFEESIHFLRIPEYEEKLLDEKIENIMQNMISVIELGRKLRENKKILLKKPVSKLTIISDKEFIENLKVVENYVIEELNANEIIYDENEEKFLKLLPKPNFNVLYKKSKEVKDTMITEDKLNDPELLKEEAESKKEANEIIEVIKLLNKEDLQKIKKEKTVTKSNVAITSEQVIVDKKFHDEFTKDKVNVCLANSDCGIIINTETNESIMNSFYCREIINRIQKLRKESGIQVLDVIEVVYSFKDKSPKLEKVSTTLKDNIEKVIKAKYHPASEKPSDEFGLHKEETFEIGEDKEKQNITISIYKHK